jgi:hypothetical protein
MEGDMPTTEQAARRFAIEDWPSNTAWTGIWDELCDEQVVLRFCGTDEAVVGLEANKDHNRVLHAGFPDRLSWNSSDRQGSVDQRPDLA